MIRRILATVSLFALCLAVAGCGGGGPDRDTNGDGAGDHATNPADNGGPVPGGPEGMPIEGGE